MEPDHLNPFRTARREKRDACDQARAEVRSEVEPVPNVLCTQCGSSEAMEYLREYSSPSIESSTPFIEVTWECVDCDGLAFGYVTPDGLTSVLDNAEPAPQPSDSHDQETG